MRLGRLELYHETGSPYWGIRIHPKWSYIVIDLGTHQFGAEWHRAALGQWVSRRRMRRLFGPGWDRHP